MAFPRPLSILLPQGNLSAFTIFAYMFLSLESSSQVYIFEVLPFTTPPQRALVQENIVSISTEAVKTQKDW